MSKNKLTYSLLKDTTVEGIICSDNEDSENNIKAKEENIYEASCEDSPLTKPNLKAIDHSYIRVKCPALCKDKTDLKVFGILNSRPHLQLAGWD